MTELLKFILPSGFLLIGIYVFAKIFLNKLNEQKKLESKGQNQETLTPLRLQAFERMTLFLERITPNYLLLRLYERAIQVNDFQEILLREIREEYNHNLAQQIYISPETWDEIKAAMNEMLNLVNQSASELKSDDAAIMLSKNIFKKVVNEEKDPTRKALLMLKAEVRELF
jgi:glutamine synthetase adenylyltransferase